MAKKSLVVKAARPAKYKVRNYTRCNRCGRPRAVFKKFALTANFADGGYDAARTHLGIDLGMAVAAVLEKPDNEAGAYAPRPDTWMQSSMHTDTTPTTSREAAKPQYLRRMVGH